MAYFAAILSQNLLSLAIALPYLWHVYRQMFRHA